MELITTTGKLNFFLSTRDVWYVHHGWHGINRYNIKVLATHASTWVYRYSSLLPVPVSLGQQGHVAMVGRTSTSHVTGQADVEGCDPQPRYCLSNFWGKYDYLMMVMNYWNMLGWNLECINKSYYYLDSFVGYLIKTDCKKFICELTECIHLSHRMKYEYTH
jgi:hypothetical protein